MKKKHRFALWILTSCMITLCNLTSNCMHKPKDANLRFGQENFNNVCSGKKGKSRKPKKDTNDEYYTRKDDIENEMRNYNFENQVVYCNCDDPRSSQFWNYFEKNFKTLGLKKLIASGYVVQQSGTKKEKQKPIARIIERVGDGSHGDPVDIELCGDNQYLPGDFRSEDCLKLLRSCDVVVSNPPFSLLNEYLNLLLTNNKQFIFVAPERKLYTKELVKHIINGQIMHGFNPLFSFQTPSGEYKGVTCLWITNREEAMLFAYPDLKIPKAGTYDLSEAGLPESKNNYPERKFFISKSPFTTNDIVRLHHHKEMNKYSNKTKILQVSLGTFQHMPSGWSMAGYINYGNPYNPYDLLAGYPSLVLVPKEWKQDFLDKMAAEKESLRKKMESDPNFLSRKRRLKEI